MSDERKPTSVVRWIAGVALVLALYVGAYYATAGGVGDVGGEFSPAYIVPLVPESWDRALNDSLTVVFAPIHWIDRRLRPDAWR